jgi:hypothetical protein
LKFSGLPEALGFNLWAFFWEIVERDCAINAQKPGIVKASLLDLSRDTGMAAGKVKQALAKLVKKGLIRAFVPDNDVEECLIQVETPLKTPVAWTAVKQRIEVAQCRYAEILRITNSELRNGEGDERFLWLVDRYVEARVTDIRQFDLEILRQIAGIYSMEELKAGVKEMMNWGRGFKVNMLTGAIRMMREIEKRREDKKKNIKYREHTHKRFQNRENRIRNM